MKTICVIVFLFPGMQPRTIHLLAVYIAQLTVMTYTTIIAAHMTLNYD